MKPHLRIRKTIKWGGAAATVLLVILWIMSGWQSPQWKFASGYGGAVSKGLIGIAKGRPPASGWFGVRSWPADGHPRFNWDFRYVPFVGTDSQFGPGGMVYVPMWAVVIPLIVITIIAWRRDAVAPLPAHEALEVSVKPSASAGMNVIVPVAIVVVVILFVAWITRR